MKIVCKLAILILGDIDVGNDYGDKFSEMRNLFTEASPLTIFERFSNDKVCDLIIEESQTYAHEQMNKHNFLITKDEAKIFIEVVIFRLTHAS